MLPKYHPLHHPLGCATDLDLVVRREELQFSGSSVRAFPPLGAYPTYLRVNFKEPSSKKLSQMAAFEFQKRPYKRGFKKKVVQSGAERKKKEASACVLLFDIDPVFPIN